MTELRILNAGLTFDSPRNGDDFSAVPLGQLPLLLLTNLNAGLTFDSPRNGDDFFCFPPGTAGAAATDQP